jgi:hypothetical protein
VNRRHTSSGVRSRVVGSASPLERPDVGTAVAANRADEQRFQIRQPQALGPAVGVDQDRMPAFVVAAEHIQPARAGLPHLTEGDCLLAWHPRNLPRITSGLNTPSGRLTERVGPRRKPHRLARTDRKGNLVRLSPPRPLAFFGDGNARLRFRLPLPRMASMRRRFKETSTLNQRLSDHAER